MEKSLVTAGIIVIPTILLVIALSLTGRKVNWTPLLWAGFAFLVYFLLLRSEGVIPTPHFMEDLTLNWFGKTMTIASTLLMLCFLPSVSFRAAGLTWKQNRGSLSHVILTGTIVIIVTTGTAMLVTSTPNTSLENLFFRGPCQAWTKNCLCVGLCYFCSTRRSERA